MANSQSWSCAARIGVIEQREDITYSILHKDGVVNGLSHKRRV
jgi:hypothetical protein